MFYIPVTTDNEPITPMGFNSPGATEFLALLLDLTATEKMRWEPSRTITDSHRIAIRIDGSLPDFRLGSLGWVTIQPEPHGRAQYILGQELMRVVLLQQAGCRPSFIFQS
jgi:hypothetical protein